MQVGTLPSRDIPVRIGVTGTPLVVQKVWKQDACNRPAACAGFTCIMMTKQTAVLPAMSSQRPPSYLAHAHPCLLNLLRRHTLLYM
jgi:hypothetical protein